MIQVFISRMANDGILRVVEAQLKYLPEFGIEFAANPERAQVIVNHGTDRYWAKGAPSVSVSHGLYWSRQPWGDTYSRANMDAVESMAQAVAHTAPSEWVARALRRGGLFYPEVVYHGVDAEQFARAEVTGDFVLWNKGRTDYVSNPEDLNRIAYEMSERKFVTTFGIERPNVKALSGKPFGNVSPMDYGEMKKLVAQAGVYLCTARETFGIGTLEAMASGVPIAGWDWGGQSEIVTRGLTGYLAPPGNYEALRECIEKCFAERARLSENCIEDARTRWTWKPRIQQYANIIHRVYEDFYVLKRPKVSVIVTAYQLDRYLPQCLESVRRQTFSEFECIVVDDARMESTKRIVEGIGDRRFKYSPTPASSAAGTPPLSARDVERPLGLPGARNYGFSLARGRYIRHLDADDFLADNCLALEAEALDSDPAAHIVYGHLGTTTADGEIEKDRYGDPTRGGWPPQKFDWVSQMAHLNQLPSCVMMRREVLEKSGGYRERMKRNEDAEFWCRVTSLGFRAKKFTQAITYYHRMRDDSKGAVEWREQGAEPDWTAWFPWRVGAENYREATEILRKHAGLHPKPHLVPFGAQGRAPNMRFWYVHDYAYPVVSVIVTVGPGHEKYLVDALDSVWAQTFPDWECVVVDDTGTPLSPTPLSASTLTSPQMATQFGGRDLAGFPWARVVTTGGNKGAAAARNEGFKHARGKFVIWLDADDIWLPWLLEVMVAHAEANEGVIYSDLIIDSDGKPVRRWVKQDDRMILSDTEFITQGERKTARYPEFTPERIVQTGVYPGTSVLIPRRIAEAVFHSQGGWDTQIPGQEDWDFQFAIHALGFCAYHIEEPLFVYRMHTSTKRDADYARINETIEYMDWKWRKYRVEGVKMSCGCDSKIGVKTQPNSFLSSSGNFKIEGNVEEDKARELVKVEYMGLDEQDFTRRSKVDPGMRYRIGNNRYRKTFVAYRRDAEIFASEMDRNGEPLYRVVSGTKIFEARNAEGFLT